MGHDVESPSSGYVDVVADAVRASIATKERMLADSVLLQTVAQVADDIAAAFRADCKVLLCGNGGSAADAQHIASELSGRYALDRKPLFAEALHVNASFLTAVGNDFGFQEVFSRLVAAKGRAGDVLLCLSTSGNSQNVLLAAEEARQRSLLTVGLTGADGGALATHCDRVLRVPSTETPRIQECHLLLGHILCELVERDLFSAQPAQ